jgi:hypothetical protein
MKSNSNASMPSGGGLSLRVDNPYRRVLALRWLASLLLLGVRGAAWSVPSS